MSFYITKCYNAAHPTGLQPSARRGFGAGVSGLLLGRWLSEPLVAVGALAGGVLFERYVVTPIWNGLLRFASAPAHTLEQAVYEVARAATDFDAQGQELITIELDGQLVQVLGILRPEERASGIRVRQGVIS
jgi:hypothetical protein